MENCMRALAAMMTEGRICDQRALSERLGGCAYFTVILLSVCANLCCRLSYLAASIYN